MTYFAKIVFGTPRIIRRGLDLSRITVSACRMSSWSSMIVNKLSQSYIVESGYQKDNSSGSKDSGGSKILLGINAAFFGLFGPDRSEEEEIPELIMTIKRSVLLIQREEFKKAEQMLHVALRQAQSLQHFEAITYIYDLMANLAFDVGDYKKAETLFVSVMQRLLSTGTAQNDMKIIHISLKLAKLYDNRGDPIKAEDGYKFCLKSLQEHIDKDAEEENVILLWAMALDWYARLLLSQSKHAEAFKYFMQAYKASLKINGKEHEQTVVLLNDLGTVSYLQGEHDEAIDYLSEAAEIGKKLPEMEDLGSIHVNLGNVFMEKGLYEAAKKSCQEGKKLSKTHNNQESLVEANECLKEINRILS